MQELLSSDKLTGLEKMPMDCVVESSVSPSMSECETSFVKRATNEDEAEQHLRLESAPHTPADEAVHANSATCSITVDRLMAADEEDDANKSNPDEPI